MRRIDYAARCVALRARHGWTQHDLADKLGIHRASIPRWESGRYVPRTAPWRRLEALEAGKPMPGPEPRPASLTPREARLAVLLREAVETIRDQLLATDGPEPVRKRQSKLVQAAERALARLAA